VQGTIVKYNSGFTEGTVGFSTEVAAYNALAWTAARSKAANRSADSGRRGRRPVEQMGLANVKARVSNTTLTAGRQNFSSRSSTPSATVRCLRASKVFHSEELNNLSFDLAAPSTASPRTEESLSKFRRIRQLKPTASHPGINYQPLKSLTTSRRQGRRLLEPVLLRRHPRAGRQPG
jgi:hypothetical protein